MQNQKDDDAEFQTWCDAIDAYGRTLGCDFDYTCSTGRDEGWRGYFENGYSPKDALDEEFSYA